VNGFMPDFELTPSKGKLGDWNFFLKPSKNQIFNALLSLFLPFRDCYFSIREYVDFNGGTKTNWEGMKYAIGRARF